MQQSAGAQFPKLSLEQAKQALGLCLAAAAVPENVAKVDAAKKQIPADAPPMQAMMMKMSLLVPLITGILQEPLVKMGFGAQGELMNAAMQIKSFEDHDPEIKAGVAKLMGMITGSI